MYFKFIILCLFLSFVNATDNITLTLLNQDRSIDTSKYDCIVRFITNRNYTCTGTFVGKDKMITAQHCIDFDIIMITINNIDYYDFNHTRHEYWDYDVGYVKFNNFSYSCSRYFNIHPKLADVKGPLNLRTCGHGLNNNSNDSTDKPFGCRDLDITTFKYSADFRHCVQASLLGDSGSPLFSKDDYLIYATIAGRHPLNNCTYSTRILYDDFNGWFGISSVSYLKPNLIILLLNMIMFFLKSL